MKNIKQLLPLILFALPQLSFAVSQIHCNDCTYAPNWETIDLANHSATLTFFDGDSAGAEHYSEPFQLQSATSVGISKWVSASQNANEKGDELMIDLSKSNGTVNSAVGVSVRLNGSESALCGCQISKE